MNKSEQINELAKALAMAQGEMRNPAFDSSNPHFRSKFASLASVRNAVIPCLSKHGLSLTQDVTRTLTGIACTTILMHASGQWAEYGPLEMPASKNDAQGLGSASTYARRYHLQAVAGVVGDEDDDGNAATQPKQSAKSVAQATMDEQPDGKREELARIAADVAALLDEDRALAANAILAKLDADDKVAIWSMFDSKQRKALKDAAKSEPVPA